MNLDNTIYGSFAEIGAGQEAGWSCRSHSRRAFVSFFCPKCLKSLLEIRNSRTWQVSRTFLTAGAAAGTVVFSVLIPCVHVDRMTVLKSPEFPSSFSFFLTNP